MAPPHARTTRITRRELFAAGAGTLVVVACGGGSGGGEAATTSSTAGHSLLRFFRDGQPVGRELRLAFGLSDADGVPLTETPPELTFTIAAQDGEPGAPQKVVRHDKGIPRPYYPVAVAFEQPGPHAVLAEWEGGSARSAVTAVAAAEAPAVPGPGEPMVSLPTPTQEEPRGVDPICTREPPCPLHAVSLDRALSAGRPVAFLISTPAFCETRICGPVLEVLLAQQPAFADRVTMIHNEVYTNTKLERTTDAVQALSLTWEPVLFLVGADGAIRQRLDTIFDEVEVQAALESLLA